MTLFGKVSSGCRCDLLAHTTPFSFASSWRVGVTKSDVQDSVSAEAAQPSLSHNMVLPSLQVENVYLLKYFNPALKIKANL